MQVVRRAALRPFKSVSALVIIITSTSCREPGPLKAQIEMVTAIIVLIKVGQLEVIQHKVSNNTTREVEGGQGLNWTLNLCDNNLVKVTTCHYSIS